MGENLVIVESPAKAKTIEKFLGKEYTVRSSYGHIRDLSKTRLGIDTEHGFKPDYIVSPDKKKVVSELKSAASKAKTVWLASDEDREGEAIAWHLYDALGLEGKDTKRIAFHEITKNAIIEAIGNPRQINMDLVMAQQARRVLDRLVGFELSPVLWRKVQPKLSAGRVQSVAVRLIVDREREIAAFTCQPYYRVEGIFAAKGGKKIKGVLDTRFNSREEALEFLERCRNAEFSVASITSKSGTRTPAAPFTTSVLQQEASRKLGFSVSQTMSLAQRLYESGLITYMRTDSVNLSSLAINTSKSYITSTFGEKYSKVRQYRTKSKGAQEAHEAIRPTYMDRTEIEGSAAEKKLYSLIWKRTIASQMADAIVEKTAVAIAAPQIKERFIVEAENVKFDGFLKVYIESKDDEDAESTVAVLPAIAEGDAMTCREITATEKFTPHPPRYSEASLVKKLEELGIGRPSTYAPTISTIMKRGYIIKGDRPGTARTIQTLTLKGGEIAEQTSTELAGKEKGKLLPENIGIVVTDYLAENFKEILDYNFTAKVEEDFDTIAAGKKVWNSVIADFYAPFHGQVTQTLETRQATHTERVLGVDPASGKQVIARMGRFGPLVQKGEASEKLFASMKRGQLIESITLEEALKLFALPREVGEYEGHKITAAIGRFGPYIRYGSKFVSLGKGGDPYNITEEQAVALIKESIEKDAKKFIASFEASDIQVLNGRFGPYIKQGKNNYKIPKGTDPSQLTEQDCIAIIGSQSPKK